MQLLTNTPNPTQEIALHQISISAFPRFRISAFPKMRISQELRARTKAFASQIVRLFIRLPKQREEVQVLGKQMLRSGTSVAAQSREASRARSDAEFCSKLETLLQEADETQLWLELLREDCAIEDAAIPVCHGEADELIAIFATMVAKTRRKP